MHSNKALSVRVRACVSGGSLVHACPLHDYLPNHKLQTGIMVIRPSKKLNKRCERPSSPRPAAGRRSPSTAPTSSWLDQGRLGEGEEEDGWAESVRLARTEDGVGKLHKEKGTALVPLQCH